MNECLPTSKVTLVGLDGASLTFIQDWAGRGELPGFQKLFKEGGWGGLRSTIPPISPSAWTSIFTGVSPGKHGIFGFVKRREGSYFLRPIGSGDVRVPFLWQILTEQGIKSSWVHIPFVYPPEPINGALITGLGTPSRKSEFTYPPQLRAELLRRYPKFDVDFNEDQIELSHNIALSLRKIEEVTDASIRIFEDQRADMSNSLVAAVFRALDVVQHYRIHEHATLLRVYQKFDQLIGRCLDSLDSTEVLIVCSDHGFREVKRNFHLNNWLESLGITEMRKEPVLARLGLKAETFQKILVGLGLKELVWRIKRSDIVEILLRYLPSDDFNVGINWSNTKAYYMGNEGGTIYLNVQGREPNGVVIKGPQSKAITEKLLTSAREIKDPVTGEPVVSQAFGSAEFYPKCIPDAPEVLLVENDPYTFSGRYNYTKELFTDVGAKRGDHSMEGILFIGGDNVKSLPLPDASVCDITPTILYLLGIPIPEYIDGKILGAAFRGYSPEQNKPSLKSTPEKQHIAETIERLRKYGKL